MAPPNSSSKKTRTSVDASARTSDQDLFYRLKHVLRQLRRLLSWLWDNVIDATTVFWITRVSVISVLAGAFTLIWIPQVQDTFLEMRGNGPFSRSNLLLWGFFLFSAVLFWALPVHYAARRDVRRDPRLRWREKGPLRRVDRWGEWIPRLLGAACLASITIAASLAQNPLRVPSEAQSALEQSYQYLTHTHAIAFFAGILCIVVFVFLTYRRHSLFKGIDQGFGTLLLACLLVLFTVLFLVPADWLGLARAPLFPLLLGGWIPLLAWLAYHGRLRRVPLIILLFVLLEALTVFGNNHDVRVLWASPDDSLSRTRPDASGWLVRPALDRSIDDWKNVNCAEGYCPRPILVAASGGASRAAYFTAATLGELVDKTRGKPGLNDFQNQLFAISSVSGSSTGGAFFAAALRAAPPTGTNPCRLSDTSELVYFNSSPVNWRQCMEQLLAGDFISTTLMAFVYKDAIRGPAALAASLGMPIPDRAALLERSWEDRFCLSTGACEKGKLGGLEAPFLKVAAQTDQDRAEKNWFPLLFFNGTDADTGRRIVVSPVASHMKDGTRIFADAYDFHDLLADSPSTDEGRKINEQAAQPGGLNRDVSLSTAALLSARFPLISPPGNILNRKDKVVARIVDGGYFENFGAATALELAHQLRQAGLSPFIIQITNDPELLFASRIEEPGTNAHDPTLCQVDDIDPLCEEDPPIIDVAAASWFAGIRVPFGALFGSRYAQGGRALRALSNFSGPGTSFCPGNPGQVSFVHIVVHPQYRVVGDKTCEPAQVPLNWWLSKPVQAYLDHQIEQNKAAVDLVVQVMKKEEHVELRGGQ